jgi:hypothetical protein
VLLSIFHEVYVCKFFRPLMLTLYSNVVFSQYRLRINKKGNIRYLFSWIHVSFQYTIVSSKVSNFTLSIFSILCKEIVQIK